MLPADLARGKKKTILTLGNVRVCDDCYHKSEPIKEKNDHEDSFDSISDMEDIEKNYIHSKIKT